MGKLSLPQISEWKEEDTINFYGKDTVNQLPKKRSGEACSSNEIWTGWSTNPVHHNIVFTQK